MAGIDNNTVLMLHGEKIIDSSINPKTLINNNVTSIEEGVFGNCLSLVGNDKRLSTDIGNIGNTFTIDFRVKRLSTSTRDNPIFTIGSTNGFWVGFNASQNFNGSMYFSFKSSTIKNSIDVPVNEWVNVRFVCQEKNLSIYIQGIKVHSSTLTSDMVGGEFALGVYNIGNADPANMLIDEFIITKDILNTENFTPPTQPYNSIDIDVKSQTATNVNFNVTKLGQETINKVEVLVNGTVSETYSDNYDNINYLIDTELCMIGNNDITIRVAYDDTYTEELSLTHKVTVDELPLETSLLDTVERVKLLTKSKQNEKTMLSSILTSKNVEVSEEDKMSDLIGKVNEMDYSKMYLYKSGKKNIDFSYLTLSYYPQIGIYNENSDHIFLKVNVNQGLLFRTTSLVDTSQYSKLCFEYESSIPIENTYNAYSFGCSTNDTIASTDIEYQSKKTENRRIYSFDLSTYNKLAYIFLKLECYAGDSVDVNIYNMWLEK